MIEEYVSKDGDRIDCVVFDFYGDVSFLQEFLDANPGVAGCPFLEAGVVLRFPEKTIRVESSVKLWG